MLSRFHRTGLYWTSGVWCTHSCVMSHRANPGQQESQTLNRTSLLRNVNLGLGEAFGPTLCGRITWLLEHRRLADTNRWELIAHGALRASRLRAAGMPGAGSRM